MLWLALRRWPMPTSAILCIAAFMALHTIGGRYIYSYVPYEQWLGALGLPSIDHAFGLGRNSWDRLVHFSFGALWACIVVRIAKVNDRLAQRSGRVWRHAFAF